MADADKTVDQWYAELAADPQYAKLYDSFDDGGAQLRRVEVSATERDRRLRQWAQDRFDIAQRDKLGADLRTTRQQIRTALAQLQAARDKLAVTPADRQAFAALPLYPAANQADKGQIMRVGLDEVIQDVIGAIRLLVD